MSDRAPNRDVYRERLLLPENITGEIVAGELYASPRPVAKHVAISSSLGMELGVPFQKGLGGPGGWWILDEIEIHLEGDIFIPDLAGWRKTRLPQIPDEPALSLTPDWICEILSPSTARRDRMIKLPAYAQHGIPWAWIVDPKDSLIEVFELRDGRWLLHGTFGGAQKAAMAPFEAVELDLSLLWPNPPESA